MFLPAEWAIMYPHVSRPLPPGTAKMSSLHYLLRVLSENLNRWSFVNWNGDWLGLSMSSSSLRCLEPHEFRQTLASQVAAACRCPPSFILLAAVGVAADAGSRVRWVPRFCTLGYRLSAKLILTLARQDQRRPVHHSTHPPSCAQTMCTQVNVVMRIIVRISFLATFM
jgi:hypothetical protein